MPVPASVLPCRSSGPPQLCDGSDMQPTRLRVLAVSHVEMETRKDKGRRMFTWSRSWENGSPKRATSFAYNRFYTPCPIRSLNGLNSSWLSSSTLKRCHLLTTVCFLISFLYFLFCCAFIFSLASNHSRINRWPDDLGEEHLDLPKLGLKFEALDSAIRSLSLSLPLTLNV